MDQIQEGIDESSMHIPKKKGVIILLLLSLITLGAYPFIWYIKRAPELNNLQTPSKLKKGIPLFLFILWLLLIATIIAAVLVDQTTNQSVGDVSDISNVPLIFKILFSAGALFLLIDLIIAIILGLKISKILNQALANKGEKVKVSALFTLIFNFFYLQYEINRIIDDKENEKRIGAWISLITIYILVLLTVAILIVMKNTYGIDVLGPIFNFQ